jgi:hypothetical protein
VSEHRTLLYLAWTTLAVAIAILVLTILHRRRLNQVSDQLAEGAVDNGETLKGVVKFENDATRKHVSNAVDAVRSDTKLSKQTMYDFVERQTMDSNEFRGQMTSLKERVQHLIRAGDLLTDRVRALPGQIKEWLTDGKEPPKL